mgnify:CR=1 FL=1
MTSGSNRRKLNDFTRTNIEGTEEVEKKDSDEDTKESLNCLKFLGITAYENMPLTEIKNDKKNIICLGIIT